MTILIGVHFFLVAKGKEEYMYSLFTFAAPLFSGSIYASFILKRDKIFDTIELAEKVLGESAFLISPFISV